jgi:hypothetical protein
MTPAVCVTPVTCSTSLGRYDSGRLTRLRSTSQLQTHLLTLVTYHDFGRWTHCMSYYLSCERLRMAGLDDCSILQPRHLVRNRPGGTYDLISAQNLRSHSFACRSNQAMCRATKEHLACRGLRQTRVSGGTRYQKTLKDQGLRISGHVSLGSMPRDHGTKNWSHLWKTLAGKTEQSFDSSGQRPRMTLQAGHMMPTTLSTR